MNAIQTFLKNFAIGYAVSYIATTMADNMKDNTHIEVPANTIKKTSSKPAGRFGKVGPDGTFIPN